MNINMHISTNNYMLISIHMNNVNKKIGINRVPIFQARIFYLFFLGSFKQLNKRIKKGKKECMNMEMWIHFP